MLRFGILSVIGLVSLVKGEIDILDDSYEAPELTLPDSEIHMTLVTQDIANLTPEEI